MRVPDRKIGDWAMGLIDECSVSMKERQSRGLSQKNLFLVGDPMGNPATFPLTYAYIDNLSSYIYSPAELRYTIAPYGKAGARDRALCKAAEGVLSEHVHVSGLDELLDEAVTWSLVKGITFVQMLWTKNGLTPYLVQPELFGVRHEYKQNLDQEMEAFFHQYYLSPSAFDSMVARHPKRKRLMSNVRQYFGPEAGNAGRPDAESGFPVIVGGLYPYKTAGSQTTTNRGQAMWLNGPQATLSPKLVSQLICMRELWVWDDARDDWTTIVLAGPDCVVEGEIAHRNIYAEQRSGPRDPDARNPLKGCHPFVIFRPNKLDSYFWGRSEMNNVGLLQRALNNRVNGINQMLRLQEKPPRVFSGANASTNQQAYAKLNKPGGYIKENAPTLKIDTLAPTIPQDMWTSLAELKNMFHEMGGLPPVMRGEGTQGVRAQGHAETLLRTGSPRIIDRSLSAERSVSECGELAVKLLEAHLGEKQVAWVPEKEAGPFKSIMLDPEIYEPPAPGLHGIEFLMSHIPESARTRVSSHSSSPAFVREARQLAFDLAARGALSNINLVEATNPPNAENIVSDLERQDAEKAEFLAQHPELALHHGGKKK